MLWFFRDWFSDLTIKFLELKFTSIRLACWALTPPSGPGPSLKEVCVDFNWNNPNRIFKFQGVCGVLWLKMNPRFSWKIQIKKTAKIRPLGNFFPCHTGASCARSGQAFLKAWVLPNETMDVDHVQTREKFGAVFSVRVCGCLFATSKSQRWAWP